MPKKTKIVPIPFTIRRYSRHQYFVERLKVLGLFDQHSDYSGMIGEAVKELSLVFAKQGHSGQSAEITVHVFNELMKEWKEKPCGSFSSVKLPGSKGRGIAYKPLKPTE